MNTGLFLEDDAISLPALLRRGNDRVEHGCSHCKLVLGEHLDELLQSLERNKSQEPKASSQKKTASGANGIL